MTPRRYALLAAALALAACDSSATIGPDDMRAGDLAARDLQADRGDLTSAYPPPPYGHVVGAVLPSLTWEGYVDPLADALAGSKPYGAYSTNDLRLSGRRYAVVHVAEFS